MYYVPLDLCHAPTKSQLTVFDDCNVDWSLRRHDMSRVYLLSYTHSLQSICNNSTLLISLINYEITCSTYIIAPIVYFLFLRFLLMFFIECCFVLQIFRYSLLFVTLCYVRSMPLRLFRPFTAATVPLRRSLTPNSLQSETNVRTCGASTNTVRLWTVCGGRLSRSLWIDDRQFIMISPFTCILMSSLADAMNVWSVACGHNIPASFSLSRSRLGQP